VGSIDNILEIYGHCVFDPCKIEDKHPASKKLVSRRDVHHYLVLLTHLDEFGTKLWRLQWITLDKLIDVLKQHHDDASSMALLEGVMGYADAIVRTAVEQAERSGLSGTRHCASAAAVTDAMMEASVYATASDSLHDDAVARQSGLAASQAMEKLALAAARNETVAAAVAAFLEPADGDGELSEGETDGDLEEEPAAWHYSPPRAEPATAAPVPAAPGAPHARSSTGKQKVPSVPPVAQASPRRTGAAPSAPGPEVRSLRSSPRRTNAAQTAAASSTCAAAPLSEADPSAPRPTSRKRPAEAPAAPAAPVAAGARASRGKAAPKRAPHPIMAGINDASSDEEANAARNARATAFFAAQQQRSGESDSD
jgi:hypothetical protein